MHHNDKGSFTTQEVYKKLKERVNSEGLVGNFSKNILLGRSDIPHKCLLWDPDRKQP